MDDGWLDAANASDLLAVARALRDGRLAPPYEASAFQLAGVAGAHALVGSFGSAPPTALAWMLERLARERRAADDRLANIARLVWSGAAEGEGTTRDTRAVLEELFARAERHVLIATYAIHHGRAVFAKLGEQLAKRPGLDIEIHVNLPSPSGRPEEERADVAAYLDDFTRRQWPERTRLPALYYDPETRKHGDKRTSLHAKCVVVDQRWAFVTSANFTEAAQDRNIEAGVLLDHPRLAAALAERFRGLRESGRLRRMGERG